jgi:Tfp pilus assembly protein PilF
MAYIKQASENSPKKRLWYGLSLAAFSLSLLSRAWGITLPLTLLVFDVYPLRRLSIRKGSEPSLKALLLEKVPFGVFAAVAALLAILAKSSSMTDPVRHGLFERFMQAAYGLVFYPIKTIAPFGLSPLYLLDETFDAASPPYFAAAFAVVGITAFLWIMRRRWPWAFTGWILYAITVSPLLGLVQSGPQLAADRYTYVSTLPFAALVGAGALRMSNAAMAGSPRHAVGSAARLGTMMVLLLLAALTVNQIRIWQNPITLWSHVARLDPDNYIAFHHLGTHYKDALGAPAEAMPYFNQALEINPDFHAAYYNRAQARERIGDIDGAIEDYTSVIERQPRHERAYNNRGVLRQGKGDLAGALADYHAVLDIDPHSLTAHINFGGLHARQGDLASAEEYYRRALELSPSDWPGAGKLRKLLDKIGKRRDAASQNAESAQIQNK